MTDDAKKLVEALREHAEWARANEWETPITLGDNLTEAADLIEKLSAELARDERHYYRDAFAILADEGAKLEAERNEWKRRAEAAVYDMAKCCAVCKYDAGSMCMNPNGCRNISGTNTGWEWRGPCAENGGDDRE